MLETKFEKYTEKILSRGMEKGKIDDARKMVEKGMTNADIRDITGLSVRKIQELRKMARS